MSARPTGRQPGRWLAIAASLVVMATVVAAVMAMGPPSAQRAAKLDQKRVEDLERIVQAISRYADNHDALPPDLRVLSRQSGRRLSLVDPGDSTPYAYQVTGGRTFRLCAVFATDSAKVGGAAIPWADDEWGHAAGRQCFDRKPRKQ
jgi:hypothetical protein